MESKEKLAAEKDEKHEKVIASFSSSFVPFRGENPMIKIHPTAIIEDDVKIGEGTSVWDNVHIRHGAQIGDECIVGEKTYIAYDVKIGNCVKINAMVYICAAVTIEDGVMISASTTFTNDRFPRATFPDLKNLRPSEPDEHTLPTLVREGATIGAGCIIGNDLEIGRWAMVGMGSIVTKSVPDFHLVLGSPARSVGAVCKCGQLMHRFAENYQTQEASLNCPSCDSRYSMKQGRISEL
jgi:acetyltransferase-like isoleucine patch superfamily enzyme